MRNGTRACPPFQPPALPVPRGEGWACRLTGSRRTVQSPVPRASSSPLCHTLNHAKPLSIAPCHSKERITSCAARGRAGEGSGLLRAKCHQPTSVPTSAMTGAVGAEVGTDVGAATGSDIEVGVAPLHPTTAKIAIAPTKSGVTRHRARYSPLAFPLLISIPHAAMPASLGVIALILPRAFWTLGRMPK